MFGGICIIFLMGTIDYSLFYPHPGPKLLDVINININEGKGKVLENFYEYGNTDSEDYGYLDALEPEIEPEPAMPEAGFRAGAGAEVRAGVGSGISWYQHDQNKSRFLQSKVGVREKIMPMELYTVDK